MLVNPTERKGAALVIVAKLSEKEGSQGEARQRTRFPIQDTR